MHELLHALPAGALVLDLGCAEGSFAASDQHTVVRIDREPAARALPNFARADAAHLPFRENTFDLIVSNHSLEHFDDLAAALAEIQRVVKRQGALYISVPDSSTFCDRLYRWLARGGGHVNAFRSARLLADQIERATGLPHVATRTLCTSLSFLNRRNAPSPRPRKLLLLGNGNESALRLISRLSRLCDRFFGTRLSVYGWALYFGNVSMPIEASPWINVCVRCGAGHPSQWLLHQPGGVRRQLWSRIYICPNCGARNVFHDDEPYRQLWNNE